MITVLTTIALIIIGVLLFELIILFHEGGHFAAAKKSGVQVNEFSIGMGPRLFGFKKGDTEYSFRLLPIGGYCSMEAEEEESENPRAFTNAKIWKRMIIIVAGAFMNIVLGLIMMFAIVVQSPNYYSTTVDSFPQSSFSANCGLEKGDKIVRMNNYSIYTSQDMSFAFATMDWKEYSGDSLAIYKQDCSIELCQLYNTMYNDKNAKYSEDTLEAVMSCITRGCEKINSASNKNRAKAVMDEYYAEANGIAGIEAYKIPEIKAQDTRKRFRTTLEVIRHGERITLENVDFYTYLESEDAKEPSVSVDFYVKPIKKTALEVIKQTGMQTFSVVRMVWSSLVGLVTGQFGFNDISGPIGAASAVTQVASQGLESSFLDAFNNILYMMMMISVNLGIFNMLPFPALDGGRFLFLLIEAVFRKPVPRKVESVVNGIGLGILLLFMLIISVKDVWQLLPFSRGG